MTKKVLTIVGARPQFIKAAPVSRAFKTRSDMKEILVHTGQHYDDNMSDVFFSELEIPKPNYHLAIGSSSHGAQTGRMLEAIEGVLLAEQPNWVLVYGDTNSTLAGALAAAKLHIPIAHVEAGLRSFNRQMPEEINRVLTDHASDLLLCPTQTAVENLRREGIASEKIRLVGDVMYDAALYYGARADKRSSIIERLSLTSKNYVLATVHRAENTDDLTRLTAILEGLSKISLELQIPVVFPLHPRTKTALARTRFGDRIMQDLQVIAPVGYLDMVMLEKNAQLIATDSGGVQKEAFFYKVPCVTLREETEWVELVELGWNRVVPPYSINEVVKGVKLSLSASYPEGDSRPYGSGHASQGVVQQLTEANFSRARA